MLALPLFLALAPVAWANAEAQAGADKAAPAAVNNWHVREIDGVEYVPLEDLRSFYKLMPLQPKGRKVAGQRMLGNGEVELVFGPAPRELYIQGRLCALSHPVQEDASGDLLVSRTDVLQVIEPVLRPTYIANRRAVRTVVIDPGHGGSDPHAGGECRNHVLGVCGIHRAVHNVVQACGRRQAEVHDGRI